MKVIVAGSRTIVDQQAIDDAIEAALLEWRGIGVIVEEIVSGGASGVDELGVNWARSHGVAWRVDTLCVNLAYKMRLSIKEHGDMATKEMRLVGKPTVQEQAATMAVAILVERIRRLPKEDQDDLYELMKELTNGGSEDENKEVWSTMQEILDQKPVTLSKIECESKGLSTLQGWADYFGKKLRELREKAGMTQSQLAEKTGLPQSHISRLEACKHSPSHATLTKIAAGLGVDIKVLDPIID